MSHWSATHVHLLLQAVTMIAHHHWALTGLPPLVSPLPRQAFVQHLQVHGTCLGLETLSIIISGNTSILSDMDAEDAPAPLLYTDEADSSRFLQALPPHLLTHLQNQPLAMENHMHGETLH